MHKRKNGFSLVEIIVLLVVVSIAAAPMTALLCQTLSDRAHAGMQIMATSLAQGVMEEILSKAYEDPDGSAGSFGTEEGSRINYDDVDDYDGLDDAPPRDSQGNALTSFSGFRARVAVENVTATSPDGTAQSDGSTDFKRVTVAVSWNSGSKLVRLKGLRSNFDASESGGGLINIQRLNASWKDCQFRFQNDSGSDIYLTHLIATWSSPTAYYQKIRVNVSGWVDVWKYQDHNNVRMGSGGTAMFNQGARVLVPDGSSVDILLDEFKASPSGGSSQNVDGTEFTIELWAAPTQFDPFTVPPE